MKKLMLLGLLVAGGAAAFVYQKPCLGDDCNFGKPCYTHSQCDCGLSCLKVRGAGPFERMRCQF